MVQVLFVCLGNICRSPSAEGLFRAAVHRAGLSGRVGADSAGTSAWNIDQPPDPRAQEACRRRGIDLAGLRARQAGPQDFHRFDYVLAMDRQNHADLFALCPPGRQNRLRLLLDFASAAARRDVPDPYAYGMEAFEEMLDLIDAGCAGLLDHLRRTHLMPASTP